MRNNFAETNCVRDGERHDNVCSPAVTLPDHQGFNVYDDLRGLDPSLGIRQDSGPTVGSVAEDR